MHEQSKAAMTAFGILVDPCLKVAYLFKGNPCERGLLLLLLLLVSMMMWKSKAQMLH